MAHQSLCSSIGMPHSIQTRILFLGWVFHPKSLANLDIRASRLRAKTLLGPEWFSYFAATIILAGMALPPPAPAPDPPASRPRGRRSGRYAGPLLSAVTVLLFLAAILGAEGLLRLFGTDRLEDDPATGLGRLHRYSETYGWELRPGFRGEWGGKSTTVNARGGRGEEHPYEKASGRPRVVMLGDSLAFGFQVADDETFSARIEAAGRFDVVNLAVPGYGTDQALIRLEEEGLRYHPDVVVLNFCLENDIVDNVSSTFFYDGVHPKPYFRLEGGVLRKYDAHLGRSAPVRLALWLREHSRLYSRLVGSPPVPRGGGEWAQRMAEVLGDRESAVALAAALIARMGEVTRARGASFLVLVYPNKAAFKDGSPLLDALVHSPRLQDVRVIDMGDRFRARGLRFGDFAQDAIGHLSPTGHRVTAAIVEELLSSR